MLPMCYRARLLGSNLSRTTQLLSSTVLKESKVSEGQQALNRIKEMYKAKKYVEALQEIDRVQANYPSCIKALTFYRGEVTYALLEEKGLLKNLGPTI